MHGIQIDQGVILQFSHSLTSPNANKRSFIICLVTAVLT